MLVAALYNHIPIGVCVVKRDRKDMRILYANATLKNMLFRGHDEDLTGHYLEEIWPDKGGHLLAQQLKSTVQPEQLTLSLNNPDGKGTRWIKIDIVRQEWKDDGPALDSYMLWATDITSSKEKEIQLRDEIEKADAMAEMKSNFLATMSHEIRTPMQTIYGLLELIHDEDIEAKVRNMVEIAQNSASGLLEILDDVLDLAKMDANKMELDIFEVPVRLLVRGLLEALAVKVHGKDVELIDDIEQDVPFVIIGDPKRLRQIIMNLCGNAMKFTDEGSVTVRVSTKTKHIIAPDKGVALRFEIVDTGIGMSQEVCDRLFQSFSQADSSTSRKFGGTGLGLSISKKLVELMGGEIGVESKEGNGSTFWFEIPTEEVSADETTIELPELDGISVLSVEDHPKGAKEIVNSLRSMGATVEHCSTYAEGLELAKRRPFDVGVIDQGLPDGLGLDLIKEIMDVRPNMGLVMYTVRDDVGLSHSLQALGVSYLTKPASRAGLGEAVKSAAARTGHFRIDGPRRLLIAEDTESVRDILQRQLEKLHVEADFAHDGKQALEMLDTGRYGLLITDLHMPEVDGYKLVKTLRDQEDAGGSEDEENGQPFPIIVLTADVQMAQRETYMRYGFDECLLKPVSLGQFRRLLMRWGLIEEQDQASKPAAPKATPKATSKEAKPKESTAKPQAQDDAAPSDTTPDALQPAIDRKAMEEQMGGFDDDVIEMLGMFVEMTAPLIDKLQVAKEDKDLHILQETAHSLKGGARSACCNVLGDLASRLQSASEANQVRADIVDQIAEEFKRVEKEVAALKS